MDVFHINYQISLSHQRCMTSFRIKIRVAFQDVARVNDSELNENYENCIQEKKLSI